MSGRRRWMWGGLAGVLLALATPTVQAQTPAASDGTIANSQRPATIAELDETRIAVSETGDQATVVAEATVTPHAAPPAATSPGPGCDATADACPFGRLLDPVTDDVVDVDARTEVASLYSPPEPVTGLLAFALVDQDVELLGTLSPAEDGSYLVPLTPDAMAAADALPLGSLIAVDGWLEELAYGVPCPASPGDDDTAFSHCPGGWITPAPFVPPHSDTDVTMRPAGLGIPVQASAYDAFAPDPQPVMADYAKPPREAVYLLRRVANPIAGAEPAAGWHVIGRLDPID